MAIIESEEEKKEIEKRQGMEIVTEPAVNEKVSTIEEMHVTATTMNEADTFLQFEEKTDEKSDHYKKEELHVISEEIDI
ncbi:MAG TPA: hypothetical protein PLR54_08585, partial [Spirochaetota bacterium]|nr:hypothetical protein [Spirochaetota bacterium]